MERDAEAQILEEIWGPDIRALPPIEDYAARLESLRDRPEEFAEMWFDIAVEMGGRGSVSLFWETGLADDARPRLCYGYSCDDLEDERGRRFEILTGLLPKSGAIRDALYSLLLAHGLYCDARHTPRREVFASVRRALGAGARIMFDGDGRLIVGGAWPAVRLDRRSDIELAEAHAATEELTRLTRRWRAADVIKRIVRMAGARSGEWTVLRPGAA